MIDVILEMEYNHVEYMCNFCRFWENEMFAARRAVLSTS